MVEYGNAYIFDARHGGAYVSLGECGHGTFEAFIERQFIDIMASHKKHGVIDIGKYIKARKEHNHVVEVVRGSRKINVGAEDIKLYDRYRGDEAYPTENFYETNNLTNNFEQFLVSAFDVTKIEVYPYAKNVITSANNPEKRFAAFAQEGFDIYPYKKMFQTETFQEGLKQHLSLFNTAPTKDEIKENF